jgi:hypothetical protein
MAGGVPPAAIPVPAAADAVGAIPSAALWLLIAVGLPLVPVALAASLDEPQPARVIVPIPTSAIKETKDVRVMAARLAQQYLNQ